ncbi:MAG TPA: PrsW family glutamic-type intramembrane protease [Rhodothermales bacterium]|nr:PrsW family glutamic-type intramembrane protease [Rhodothermales bacterium]
MDAVVTFGAIIIGTGIWLYILRRYDRIEPEDLRNLINVAVLGGLASVLVAALANEGVSRALGIRSSVFLNAERIPLQKLLLFTGIVGFAEEICKATATVYVTRRFGNLDEPIDAMIYAMTVGLGFAAFENALYATRFGNEVLLVRFLWPVPAHMSYAALWGYGLALARFVYPDRNWFEVMWPSIAVAGVVHAASNFLLFMQESYTALISLAALGVLAYLAHQRLTRLVAESPFLEPGECPVCRNLNPPRAKHCVHCGAPLQETEIFVTCECGQARVNIHGGQCPACGRVLESDRAHEHWLSLRPERQGAAAQGRQNTGGRTEKRRGGDKRRDA